MKNILLILIFLIMSIVVSFSQEEGCYNAVEEIESGYPIIRINCLEDIEVAEIELNIPDFFDGSLELEGFLENADIEYNKPTLAIFAKETNGKSARIINKNDLNIEIVKIRLHDFQGKILAQCVSCPEGLEKCNNDCVDLNTNPEHCGSCGNICPEGENCEDGVCVSCPEGLEKCDNDCVDLNTNPEHCGSCGNICPDNERCVGGECKIIPCPDGQKQCGDKCVDLKSDSENCGKCNHLCLEQQRCQDGVCTCPDGQIKCGNMCVDPKSDSENCGKCNHLCLEQQRCQNGVCTCPDGQKKCGNECVDLKNDSENCGKCNHSCLEQQRCQDGICLCPNGLDECNDSCINITSDRDNCGRCDNECSKILGKWRIYDECYNGTCCGSGRIMDSILKDFIIVILIIFIKLIEHRIRGGGPKDSLMRFIFILTDCVMAALYFFYALFEPCSIYRDCGSWEVLILLIIALILLFFYWKGDVNRLVEKLAGNMNHQQ